MDQAQIAPETRRLTPRQLDRRRRILAAAQGLVAERGLDGVSMREIAAASHTAEKTLYNIFGTKHRLVALAAHDRSADVFVEAARRSPENGWPRLVAFCEVASAVTLAEPAIARALAVLLVEYSELVGLNRVYDDHVGAALAHMGAAGWLRDHTAIGPIVRMIRLALVSAVLFWAKCEIEDEELAPFMLMRLSETVLPHAVAPHRDTIAAAGLHAFDVLAGRAIPAPAIAGRLPTPDEG